MYTQQQGSATVLHSHVAFFFGFRNWAACVGNIDNEKNVNILGRKLEITR